MKSLKNNKKQNKTTFGFEVVAKKKQQLTQKVFK